MEKIDWLNDNNKSELAYEYWNDIEIEKRKAYYSDKQEFAECLAYVKNLGVYQNLEKIAEYLTTTDYGISLAAGVCWDADIFIKKFKVKQMDFLDFSEHRIFDLAPQMFSYLKIPMNSDYRLIRGNFYEVKMTEGTYDFVVLCEALMMAEHPERLLKECFRILKKNGKILIVGEPKLDFRKTLRYIQSLIKNIILNHSIMVQGTDKDESGAHGYALFSYKSMFRRQGFLLEYIGKDNSKFWYFILKK